jgi:hypothetical protein
MVNFKNTISFNFEHRIVQLFCLAYFDTWVTFRWPISAEIRCEQISQTYKKNH